MRISDILKFLIAISVVPSVFYMWFTYKKDKIEKEPVDLIVKLFFIGGFSIIVVAFLENWLSNVAGNVSNLIEAFCIVALTEELVKFVILKTITWKNKNFNYTFDAIVYSVAVGLGFAAFENIIYVFSTGILTAVLRALISIPGHMTFGMLMGVFYGRAKVCEKRSNYAQKNKNLILSLIVPILLHGLFDYCLIEANLMFLLIFLVIVIALYIIIFRGLNKFSESDTEIAREVIVQDDWTNNI